MLDNSQPRLEAPVAGMALTHEVGARPWQTPPQQRDYTRGSSTLHK